MTTVHHRIPGSIAPQDGIEAVRSELQGKIEREPLDPRLHAALGNALIAEDRGEALAAYRRALEIDPAYAEAHLAVAELLHGIDEEDAQRHLDEALELRTIYSAVPPRPRRTILMLAAPRPWSWNVPLDFVIDAEHNAVHRWYLTETADEQRARLPAYDVVFNAIGEAEASRAAIEAAKRFVAAQTRPVINDPRALSRTSRPALPDVLAGIVGCTVPRAERLGRSELAERTLSFPFVIRPVDSHGGRDLARVTAPGELDAYLSRSAADRFDLAAFVDYRDPDGFYRKYRVILIDGEPFPYHLALSPQWVIHYYTSPMTEQRWMREEEERFLTRPASLFADWEKTFRAIARTIGLDYFGIDCARAPDGSVIVFEADAATLVHALDPLEIFAYKQRPLARIFAAFEAMLARRD